MNTTKNILNYIRKITDTIKAIKYSRTCNTIITGNANMTGNGKTRFAMAIFILFAACMLVSCNKGEDPEQTANSFLKAYLSTNYEEASSFCTKKLSKYLIESVKELNNLDAEVKAQIVKSTADLSTKINSVEKNNSGDSVKITYSIIKTNPADSTVKIEIKNCLYLVKEEKSWKVASLN